MITVTDHAMLAFIERDIGIELELVRLAIAANVARAVAAAAELGLTDYNVRAGGVFYLVRRGAVVSIQPEATCAGPETRARSLPSCRRAAAQ